MADGVHGRPRACWSGADNVVCGEPDASTETGRGRGRERT